jgi:hypothetical protein
VSVLPSLNLTKLWSIKLGKMPTDRVDTYTFFNCLWSDWASIFAKLRVREIILKGALLLSERFISR